MKTLIISDTWDATADIVAGRLGDRAFRLNTDSIRDYEIEWSRTGFRISNPDGRSVRLSEIGSVYWGTPFAASEQGDPSCPDAVLHAETRCLVRELYNAARASGAFALVEEGAERRLGKIGPLLVARGYFSVPDWKIVLGRTCVAPPATIAKSLSGGERPFQTTRVDGQSLDPSRVWFTQQAIEKTLEVTVCYVQGRVFAFERPPSGPQAQGWRPTVLADVLTRCVHAFMEHCGLRFGRLDFAMENRELFFLGVDPNGQWVVLDPEDKAGLLSAMLHAIRGEVLPAQAEAGR